MGAGKKPRTVSLSVVHPKPAKRPIAKSKASKWRAGVLIGVNALMLLHIAQWLLSDSGRTLAPVEPSESMYAIELGKLNAGFIFFSLALLATFVFGRFFCGWGCHIVALQDLCSHWMTKLGVRPKPLRSRVLLWAPLLLALYMFVWPTFKRSVLLPLEEYISIKVAQSDLDRTKAWHFPDWLISMPRQGHPGFRDAFVIDDFWQTFPREWYVILPFLGICGFAAVYFLGSKGFCTYGCPYGGFFAPMDKLSIGRIVVDPDKCEQCGHCTAVCTSNVRVSQEVHDFGMVMDPGCMKCLDCVSVCPNDALSFKFAMPAVFTRAKTPEARAGNVRRPEYDLPLWQDFALLVIAVLSFIGFRQMYNKVPLLMAAGMGLCAAFIAWKLWTLLSEPNVRVQSLQLKLKGRLKGWGAAALVLGAAYLGLGVWGLTNQTLQAIAGYYDAQVETPFDAVVAEGYTPKAKEARNAAQALRYLKLAGPPSEGGIGWAHANELNLRMAWQSAVLADLPGAERYLRKAIANGRPPGPQWVFQLARILQAQGKTAAQVRAELEAIAADHPELYPVRLALAEDSLNAGDTITAARTAREVLASDNPKPDASVLVSAGFMLVRAGDGETGIAAVERGIEKGMEERDWAGALLGGDVLLQLNRPARAAEVALDVLSRTWAGPTPAQRLQAAGILNRAGKPAEALAVLPTIVEHRWPRPDAVVLADVASIYAQLGRLQDAETTLVKAIGMYRASAFLHERLAQVLAVGGKPEKALEHLTSAASLEPWNPVYMTATGELLQAMGRSDEGARALEKGRALEARLLSEGT
jgi:polyferredoxin/tetratricopeptide (TPR) repeat protein